MKCILTVLFKIKFMELNSFEAIRDKIIATVSKSYGNEETYIVCNVFSRLSIYLVGKREEIKNQLQASLNGLVETVACIDEDGLVHRDLKKDFDSISVETPNLFYVDRHFDKLNWFYSKPKYQSPCPIACFYSFKGGLGRTTALVLSAVALAREGKKVVLIDFDLEAPGLSTLFSNDFPNSGETKGTVDYLTDLSSLRLETEKMRLSDYYFTINRQDVVGTKGGELIVFPATSMEIGNGEGDAYLNKLSKINLSFEESQLFLPDILFNQIQKHLEPDFILIDTRTGINDIGGLFLARYAKASFLFFFGNKQNMFGLGAILERLKRMQSKFYLVNSPVPQGSLSSEEKDYYLDASYQLFQNHYYGEDNSFYIRDETAPHFPIEVPFSNTAVMLDNVEKFKILLEEQGSENPYKRIAHLIASESEDTPSVARHSPQVESGNSNLLKAFIKIAPEGTAASEHEFESLPDLQQKFYPRKDYKFIFDKNKFLVLGEKGAGKTALYAVLSNKTYADALANYCEVRSEEFGSMEWLKGFDKTKDFPSKSVFVGMSSFDFNELGRFWMLMLLRYAGIETLPQLEIAKQAKEASWSEFIGIAKNELIGIALEEAISKLNGQLEREGKYFTYIYDYLDRELPEENGARGKIVGALLDMWYRFLNRYSHIRAKIFLRKDIFESEVEMTDKVKLNNHIAEIEWEINQLLNVIWKRTWELGEDLPEWFKNAVQPDSKQIVGLGIIPQLQEDENRSLLKRLLGEYMGGNKKAFPYNWIIYHVSDTARRIQPRSMLNLFSEAAKKQQEAKEISETSLKPKFMELAMKKVSTHRVQDIKEEYPTLSKFFETLHIQVPQSPIEEGKLNDALDNIIREHTLPISAEKAKEQLIKIGVLYKYKVTKKDTEKRYHIPDLFLFGMGLNRRGPGARYFFEKK